MPTIDTDFYDAQQIRQAWKDEFADLCDDLGIAFVAEHLHVAEATVRSWKSQKGKMPPGDRMLWIQARFSQIKENRLITNTVLCALFRLTEVDDFRTTGDGCIRGEAVDLLRLAGRIADAAMQEDGDAGLRLMDVWDDLGKRFRGDFEAMKASER